MTAASPSASQDTLLHSASRLSVAAGPIVEAAVAQLPDADPVLMALVASEATATAAGDALAVAAKEAAPPSAVEVGGGGRVGQFERCPPRLFPAGCRSSVWVRMRKPVIRVAGDEWSVAWGEAVGSELGG